jgi:2-polyprenyl-6-methoxyphenol hydroxylase-like FAD-dependent oxidoreductase
MAQLQACQNWQDPLVIVGAGPVGLSIALGLSYYGVPSIILDDAEGPAIEGSRAIFTERHTLEILGAWSSVGQQVAEQGMTLTGGRVFFRQTELYKTFSTPLEQGMPYPRFVNMPQNALERLLCEALSLWNCCQIRWNHKVTGITQEHEGVTLKAMTPSGSMEIHAPYVIAADGPRSTMRHLLELSFPGESRDHHFLILDVRMHLETPRERWFWFDPLFNPGRTALLHPQPDNIYRIDYQLPPHENLEEALQPTSLHKRIVATVGERPYEIVWKSIYTYQQRALEQFKHGHVLFAGDAAHLMSPFGGRGLNSGVQDAWNLVWKLVLLRAGLVSETLLDTYHDERHAAALENLRLTANTMQFLVPPNHFAHWKRDMILRASLPFKFMRRHVNAGHMSNPFVYRNSPIVFEDTRLYSTLSRGQRHILKRFRLGPCAGALAPNLVLLDASTHEPMQVLAHCCNGFVALYFCSDVHIGIEAFDRIQNDLPDVPIELYLITPQPPTHLPESRIPILLDEDAKGAKTYNSGAATLYLIRPDRHIAARLFKSNGSELPLLLRRATHCL